MSFQTKNLAPFARGDDWTVKFTIKTSAGVVVDIDGYTYWMTLKLDPDASDPGDAQQVVSPTGGDATNGIVTITFPSNVTSELTPANYYYDLQQIDDLNNITTVLMGKVKVVRDITLSSV